MSQKLSWLLFSFNPLAAFIFEDIGEDEVIGDFGLIGGGSAGLEID